MKRDVLLEEGHASSENDLKGDVLPEEEGHINSENDFLYPAFCPPLFVFRTPSGEFKYSAKQKEKGKGKRGKQEKKNEEVPLKESLLSRRIQYQITHQINTRAADLFQSYFKDKETIGTPSILFDIIEWIQNIGSSFAANPPPIREIIPASCIISSIYGLPEDKRMEMLSRRTLRNIRSGGGGGGGGGDDKGKGIENEMGEGGGEGGKLKGRWGVERSAELDSKLKTEFQYILLYVYVYIYTYVYILFC
jgi:hypothetical protein